MYCNASLGCSFSYKDCNGNTKSAFLQYEAGKLGLYAGIEDKAIDATYNQKNRLVGAKYDFGFAYVGGAYSVRDGATLATADTGELKQTRATVVVPFSAGYAVHGVYGKSETSTEASTDHTVYKLAVSKAFSKRTTAYAAYVLTDYKTASTADNNTYVVGIRHSF